MMYDDFVFSIEDSVPIQALNYILVCRSVETDLEIMHTCYYFPAMGELSRPDQEYELYEWLKTYVLYEQSS